MEKINKTEEFIEGELVCWKQGEFGDNPSSFVLSRVEKVTEDFMMEGENEWFFNKDISLMKKVQKKKNERREWSKNMDTNFFRLNKEETKFWEEEILLSEL